MSTERVTRVPPEIVTYANEHHPHLALGTVVEKAIQRVISASAAQRRAMERNGAPYAKDLGSWVPCPYTFAPELWDNFANALYGRTPNPAPMLAGAIMMELGMPPV